MADIGKYADRSIYGPLRDKFTQVAYGDTFPAASRYIGQEAAKHQVTILSDSNHGNMERRALLASPEFASEAAKAKVTHIGLEVPKNRQILLDQLAAGTLSKPTYVNMMTSFQDSGIVNRPGTHPADIKRAEEYVADTVINAAKNGIKVVALDNQIGSSVTMKSGEVHPEGTVKAFEKFWPAFSKEAQASPYFNPNVSRLQSSDFYAPERKDALMTSMKGNSDVINFMSNIESSKEDPGNRKRMAADSVVASDIQKIVQNGGKVIVDYGQGHVHRVNGDIDAHLSQAGVDTKVIDLHGNEKDFQTAYQACKAGEQSIGKCDDPYKNDRVFLDKGTLETGGAGGSTPKVAPLASLKV